MKQYIVSVRVTSCEFEDPVLDALDALAKYGLATRPKPRATIITRADPIAICFLYSDNSTYTSDDDAYRKWFQRFSFQNPIELSSSLQIDRSVNITTTFHRQSGKSIIQTKVKPALIKVFFPS